MALTRTAPRLTHEGALALVEAAAQAAAAMGVPQCIAVVHEGCNLLAFLRMDGACIGGIGVGSGTGEQDREVAALAIRAVFG